MGRPVRRRGRRSGQRGQHSAGDAILQVTITGVGYPTETGIEEYDGSALCRAPARRRSPRSRDSTFEGTSVAFVGLIEELPFRVYLLENPARVVLEVVHRA